MNLFLSIPIVFLIVRIFIEVYQSLKFFREKFDFYQLY